MEEKDANLWWDAVQDIVQKDIRKVYRKYERNESLYIHKIFHMETIMPLFEYGPLALSLELKTLDEEENKGDTYGVGPLSTKVIKQQINLGGRKDSLEREATK
jgi:hypothetical protein